MRLNLRLLILLVLALAALACGSTSPAAAPTPTASRVVVATLTQPVVAEAIPSVPTLAPTEALPTAEPTATAAPIVVPPTETPAPTAEPARAVIAPETLGQLRLLWTVDFPGDFDSLSCDPSQGACRLSTNMASYAFSADGATLAVGVCLGRQTRDKTQPGREALGCAGESVVLLYDSATGVERQRLAMPALPMALAFHPTGTPLAVGLADSTIALWDLPAGEAGGALAASLTSRGITHLAFSPDGSVLVAGGGFRLELWDWRAGAAAQAIERVYGIGISPDGRSLATLHFLEYPDAIRVYDLSQPVTFPKFALTEQYLAAVYSYHPRTGWLAAIVPGQGGMVNFWDVTTQANVGTLDFRRDWESTGVLYGVNSGGFTPDGYFLLTRSGKLTAPEAQPAATGLNETLWACGFALLDIEANRTFFTAPMLFDTCTGPEYLYLLTSSDASLLSPDGRFIAGANPLGSLGVWGIDPRAPAVAPECVGECAAP